MANIDISRFLFRPGKHYVGTGAQEGRTLLDSDYNENAQAVAEDFRASLLDIIGDKGTADCGFEVKNEAVVAMDLEFDLDVGSMFIGGHRFSLEATTPFKFQPDWLQQAAQDIPPEGTIGTTDIVYLCGWEQCVSAVEDDELFEKGMAAQTLTPAGARLPVSEGEGIEAGARVRRMARAMVRSNVGTSTDCATEWANLIAAGLNPDCTDATLSSGCELVSPIHLNVTFTGALTTEDPCAPCLPSGGYLGRENQAIRVMVTGDGSTFTWGFDNGGALHRVLFDSGTDTITMLNPPSEVRHIPLKDQIIELIPWGAVLENGQKVAEEVGRFTKVASSLDPSDGTFKVDPFPGGLNFVDTWPVGHPQKDDLPDLGKAGHYYYMRIWDRGTDIASAPELAIGTTALGNTGLEANFTFDGVQMKGCPGDYWTIATRVNTPDTLVPWALQTDERPHGPRRFYAPLALVHWIDNGGVPAPQVHDCRNVFDPLARRPSMCTYLVGADDEVCNGDFATIQAAIDALPEEGGKICVLPGQYAERIIIENRKCITIEGCGAGTKIINPNGAGSVDSATDAPLVNICASKEIRPRQPLHRGGRDLGCTCQSGRRWNPPSGGHHPQAARDRPELRHRCGWRVGGGQDGDRRARGRALQGRRLPRDAGWGLFVLPSGVLGRLRGLGS